jgi:hypothetical protein
LSQAAPATGDNQGTMVAAFRQMTGRRLLALAAITLAGAPACMLVFGNGHSSRPGSPFPPASSTAASVSPARGSAVDGCVERGLLYGLTNDEVRGEEYDRDFLSPFAPHPPLPAAGYYAPGRSPDQATLLHALYHGYVVVRYRPSLAERVKRDLGGAVERAAQPVVVVAGRGMPFAAGALVYGRSSICAGLSPTAVAQLRTWIEAARPRVGNLRAPSS